MAGRWTPWPSEGRSGFAHMSAQVALGHGGIVFGLEVSRLARNNADWYRLLDLCGATDTLIGDADGSMIETTIDLR